MTRDETKTLLKLIFLAYPNFDVTVEKVNLWAEMLADITYPVAEKNTKKHIQAIKFAPTIADIRAGFYTYTPPPEDPQIAELRRREQWDYANTAT